MSNPPIQNSLEPENKPEKQVGFPGLLRAIFSALRPKQATKNLFLFAALIFSGYITKPYQARGAILHVIVAFLLFSLTAGSIYLLNDILDVENDKQHPKKRFRPIASGRLPIPVAWGAMLFCSVGGLVLSFLLDPNFGLVALGYFVLMLAYNFYLKHQVLLDVFTIAIGFVLRTSAGGLVIHVAVSPWLLLCTFQLALFLGFGKRRQELVLLGDEAGSHRANLDEYSIPFLEQMINIVSAITIVCYSVYTIESDTSKSHPHFWITVPFVMYGVCRYLYLVYQKGWGGAPDEALLKDRMLQVSILLWFGAVVLLFLFDKPGFFGLKYQQLFSPP